MGVWSFIDKYWKMSRTGCRFNITIKVQNTLENFQRENNKKYLQQYCEVLIENKLANQEKYFGRTKYMTPVIFESDNCKHGELVNVKITSFNQNNLFGFHKTNKVKAA